MNCIKCGSPTHVTTTYQNTNNTVRRRRECMNEKCKHRFTTREKHEKTNPPKPKPLKQKAGYLIADVHHSWYNNGPSKT